MSLSQSDRAKQRRRVLQAAVGAPVVFTLPTGTVAAASLLCSDKPAALGRGTPALAVTSDPAADTLLRHEFQAYSIPIDSGQPAFGNRTAKTFVNGFTLDGKYYRVNSSTGLAELVKPVGDATKTGGRFYALVDYKKYLANPTNPVKYVYPGTSIDAAISESCATSLGVTTVSGRLP